MVVGEGVENFVPGHKQFATKNCIPTSYYYYRKLSVELRFIIVIIF